MHNVTCFLLQYKNEIFVFFRLGNYNILCMNIISLITLGILTTSTLMAADVRILSGHKPSGEASPGFKFEQIPLPAKNDAAAGAKWTLISGRRDANGGEISVLSDGKLPSEEDEPQSNFFFNAGTDGGRLILDLGKTISIKQVNSYSWHSDIRAPQVYKLYGNTADTNTLNLQPSKGTAPESCGWKLLAEVDTRPKSSEFGGQYAVSISSSNGALAECQYLLFDISRTELSTPFGNTFYSEMDVIDAQAIAPEPIRLTGSVPSVETVTTGNGKYTITIDTSETPDLADWVKAQIVPMVQEWYPKLIEMLPSEGFVAPVRFSIMFSQSMQGVAATSGTRIRCSGTWMRNNVKGEAKGAIFHEMVHVVQQYGRVRGVSRANQPPGWLTEGLTDYIRWYLFEPESKGAEITQRNFSRARYNGSYRITANFLNWVVGKYNKDLMVQLNSIFRQGKYSENIWKDLTQHTAQELDAEWRADLEKAIKK